MNKDLKEGSIRLKLLITVESFIFFLWNEIAIHFRISAVLMTFEDKRIKLGEKLV